MLKAVLFDMDGVIVDTEPLHHKAYYHLFKVLNIVVSQEDYQAFTGQSTYNICKELCRRYQLPNDPQELVEIKRKAFHDLFKNDPDLQLISGVHELIQYLYNKGIKLVLASSASMFTIDAVFDRFGLNPYFIAKFSGADLKASKPHPEIFQKAAAATGFSSKECIVIEDSTNGIKAAHSAGIFCIAFKSFHSKNQDYTLADYVVDDFSELNIEKLNKLLSF